MLERLELEAFLTLAEELHFGRTAERLHVTTGRVSQLLKKLEGRVGAPLFVRSSRTVELTEIGSQLREDLQSGYEQIARGMERAVEAASGARNSLRAGFIGALAGQVIHRAARKCAEERKGFAVLTREVQVSESLASLREGHVDVLAMSLPVTAPDIVVGPVLFSEPRMLGVPAGHRLADRTTVSLEDLAGITLLRPARSGADEWLTDRHPGHTPEGAAIVGGPRVQTFQEALQLAGAGAGAIIVGAQAQQFYSRPDLVYVPFRDAPPIEWAVTWLRAKDAPRKREFARIAREVGQAHVRG
ncbi:LysR family transcriptional regulator [Streptomyces albidoflavus]|uniref:LysR family transcriptional regulator n=1 Tax=Streptomyces albidoflavus TaxID=1886 RepID=A0ABY3H607_9ACTN|nr:LysR family transcriptional regulator [Streptomyces albidoflavus]TWV27502.1 LysR family transcriptional regulator [Streptomyces albidoflavus]